jgi:uncharacterized protein with PIN domain
MDLMAAISTASHAVSLVKQIQDLDKALDEAVFKSQTLELHEAILKLRTMLLEANTTILERDEKIHELERAVRAARNEELCPMCETGILKVTASREDPIFGVFGVQERTISCTNSDCGHTEKRQYDPKK